MDYYHNTSASDTKSTHPNQHDYDELAIIYQHLDSFTTVGSATSPMPAAIANGDFGAPSTWGNLVHRSSNGYTSIYARDFGGGNRVVTFVEWAR